jgi:hypothetical protein
MTKGPTSDSSRTGLLRPREHCTFTWTQDEDQADRTVTIRRDHCLQCVAELRRRGHRLVSEDGTDLP